MTYDCSDPDARAEGLALAARAVRGGRLVVLPTDTVYGLGCDAFNAEAVRGLLAAKHRGPDMPVPVLVGSWSTIDGLVLSVPRAARDLIEAFWPGTSARPRARSCCACPCTRSRSSCSGTWARWPFPAPTCLACRPRATPPW